MDRYMNLDSIVVACLEERWIEPIMRLLTLLAVGIGWEEISRDMEGKG